MSDAAALMDRMYRRQRHIYDLSRKFYLLGRDEAIARLRPAPGEKVLEIGCGTGRNLVKLAQAYPEARLFGLDVSREMLATAAASSARAGFASRVALAQSDATAFDPRAAIGLRKFRARDDFICLVDDPALARGARPSARRCRAWRLSPCCRFRRLRRLARPVQGGIAPVACDVRRDPARRSQRRA